MVELQPCMVLQSELDLQADDSLNRRQLMKTLNELNQRCGRGTVKLASAGLVGKQRSWTMNQE